MKMRARRVGLSAVALLALPGCSPAIPMCTLVGSTEGAVVTIPAGLVEGPARAHVTVCRDSTCLEGRGFVTEPSPDDRRVSAIEIPGFADAFVSGTVRVRADILRGRRLVARHVEEVAIRRAYPNGRECDGDGFASVTVAISRDDLRTTRAQSR